MKRIISLLSVVFCSFVCAQSQIPSPLSTPEPAVYRDAVQAQRNEQPYPGTTILPSSRRQNQAPEFRRVLLPNGIISTTILAPNEMSRKSTKDELAMMMPDQSDLTKYSEFLRESKTGLIKMINGRGCIDKNVIDSTADCLKNTVPGYGASYSFRVADYRYEQLSDLAIDDGTFKCLGIYVQGILTNIGDISLKEVDLQTSGLNFLTTYKPDGNSKKIKLNAEQFAKGISKDGFTYKSEIGVKENTTYVLRSIAYKNGMFKPIGSPSAPEDDKRGDVIVAFRVVRKSSAGTITLLWKELSRKGAPSLK